MQGRYFNEYNFTDVIQDCQADLIVEAIVEEFHDQSSIIRTVGINLNGEDRHLRNEYIFYFHFPVGRRHLNFPEQLCGMHFFNPAPVMKLVEIVRTTSTAT